MPIQVYSIQTRGHNMGGNVRCANKEEAERLYKTLLDAVTNEKPVVELEVGDSKTCIRTKELTGFGMSVHIEETPEEIKAREIARIEQGYYPNAIGYQGDCAKTVGNGLGGGLI